MIPRRLAQLPDFVDRSGLLRRGPTAARPVTIGLSSGLLGRWQLARCHQPEATIVTVVARLTPTNADIMYTPRVSG